MANGLSEKDFAAFLVRTETFTWSLEKNEGDLACFNRASWARRYGCCRVFSSVCSAVWLPLHQASASRSCWFSLRKGANYTLADKLRTDWNEIKAETFWGRFLWNLSCRSIRIQTIYNSVNLSNMSASFSMNFLFAVWWKTSSSGTFCIFIAINLTHIGTGYVMVHFKKLNSPKSVVFRSRHLIYWQENQIACFFFFFRKLDFLS